MSRQTSLRVREERSKNALARILTGLVALAIVPACGGDGGDKKCSDASCKGTGSLVVRVCNTSLTPANWAGGAEVLLTQLGGTFEETTFADTDGWFRFTELAAGTYTAEIRANRFLENRRYVITAGQETKAIPTSCGDSGGSNARVKGKVVMGPPGSDYGVYKALVQVGDSEPVETSADGSFVVRSLASGAYSVVATRGMFEARHENLVVVAEEETTLPNLNLSLPTDTFAVITGDNGDNIPQLLQSMGLNPIAQNKVGHFETISGTDTSNGKDSWISTFLNKTANYSKYRAIFIADGVSTNTLTSDYKYENKNTIKQSLDALRTWIKTSPVPGRVLYVSGSSNELLRLLLLDEARRFKFIGYNYTGKQTDIDAERGQSFKSHIGVETLSTKITIATTELLTQLGRGTQSSFDLQVNLPSQWAVMRTANEQPADAIYLTLNTAKYLDDSGSEKLLDNVPLVARLKLGNGEIIFTNLRTTSNTSQDVTAILKYTLLSISN